MLYWRSFISYIVMTCFCVVSFLPAGYYAVETYLTPFNTTPTRDSITLLEGEVLLQPNFVDDGYDKEIKYQTKIIGKKRRRHNTNEHKTNHHLHYKCNV